MSDSSRARRVALGVLLLLALTLACLLPRTIGLIRKVVLGKPSVLTPGSRVAKSRPSVALPRGSRIVPVTTAKVVSVGPQPGVAELSVGSHDGVSHGDWFVVVDRKQKLMNLVRVTKARWGTAIVSVVSQQYQMRPGDMARKGRFDRKWSVMKKARDSASNVREK